MAESALREYGDRLVGEDDFLRDIREEAGRSGIPSINVPIDLARLLELLVMQSRAKRILEIGTLFGYSAITMARALPDDGQLISLEAAPLHASIARKNIERAGLAGKVRIIEGKALESLESLQGETFDLVFIDADKETYPQYLDWALRLTAPGSTIVADNVWRNGEVLNEDADLSARTMRQFNAVVFNEPRLVTVMIPRLDCSDCATVSVVR